MEKQQDMMLVNIISTKYSPYSYLNFEQIRGSVGF